MKWKLVEKEYVYDGSIEGFLTVVYFCICFKEIPSLIISENNYENNLLNLPIFIERDTLKVKKLLKKIGEISIQSKNNIFIAFKSGNSNKEVIIFKYIISLLKYGSKLDFMKNKGSVIKISTLVKQVNLETHRLTGFLRFKELPNNVLYARFSPDNNIIENIAFHFKKNLCNEVWVIHDVKRNLGVVYDKKVIHFYNDFDFDLTDVTQDKYEELWKEYFKKIGIKERENKRCQKNFMPKRYWKYMLEVKEEA